MTVRDAETGGLDVLRECDMQALLVEILVFGVCMVDHSCLGSLAPELDEARVFSSTLVERISQGGRVARVMYSTRA